jgi:hypothetical protein
LPPPLLLLLLPPLLLLLLLSTECVQVLRPLPQSILLPPPRMHSLM